MNGVWRLDLDSPEARELSDALDLVIAQPAGVAKGNHSNLCWCMHNVFKRNFNKHDAVSGALYALWRESDLAGLQSDDVYVMELQKEKENESYWLERADAE